MASFIVPALISGIGALGGLFGNRKKTLTSTQQGTQSQQGTQNQSFSGTNVTTPQYDQIGSMLRNNLASMYLQRSQETPNFINNYRNQGLENINQGAESSRMALNRILASRGLSYSPAAATAEMGLESGRIGQQLQFENQLPIMQDELQRERLQDLSGFFSRLPVGSASEQTGQSYGTSSMTGTSSGTGTQTDPGNMLGGAFGGLGSLLAFLYGQGAFGNNKPVHSGPKTDPWSGIIP